MNLTDLSKRIESHYDMREARAIVRLVLEQHFNLSYADILCNGVECLTDKEKECLEDIIQRLQKGEPVQYILGEAEFYGRMFDVKPGVLIPRQETEMLIDKVKQCNKTKIKVLDIGTGSGCIGVTLALERPAWNIEAWDISEKALDIAKQNAKKHCAENICFRQVDILKETVNTDCYSIIVSNPPYILNKERASMESHVTDHEPSIALFVPDNDPLLFYKKIAYFAMNGHLEEGGELIFEINRAYGKDVATMMESIGFTNVTISKDIYGNDRMVAGSI